MIRSIARKNCPTFFFIDYYRGFVRLQCHLKFFRAPAGFARGFCVLSDYAEIQYLCTGVYNSLCESGILWNDPEIDIKWPVNEPILSEKDNKAQTLKDWLIRDESDLFKY